MTNPTLAPQSDEYQQIHDGIIRLVDTARTEHQCHYDCHLLGNWPTHCRI